MIFYLIRVHINRKKGLQKKRLRNVGVSRPSSLFKINKCFQEPGPSSPCAGSVWGFTHYHSHEPFIVGPALQTKRTGGEGLSKVTQLDMGSDGEVPLSLTPSAELFD